MLPILVLFAATLVSISATPLARRDSGGDLLATDLHHLDLACKALTCAATEYAGGEEAYHHIRESFAEVNRTNRIAYETAMKIPPRKIILSSINAQTKH